MGSPYVSDRRDACPHCGDRHFASLGYEDEIVTEREAIECQCGGETFCQTCVDEEATTCAHPGCRVVFCSEECAARSNSDGESYCEAHAPDLEQAIERFTVASERFQSAAKAARVCVDESASGF